MKFGEISRVLHFPGFECPNRKISRKVHSAGGWCLISCIGIDSLFSRMITVITASCFIFIKKVAERKFPEFFQFSSGILLRIFPEIFEDFSRFTSWEMETTEDNPQIPPFFQCQIPTEFEEKDTKDFCISPSNNLISHAPPFGLCCHFLLPHWFPGLTTRD